MIMTIPLNKSMDSIRRERGEAVDILAMILIEQNTFSMQK